jgi:[citrate (pro-3S)-lyase] ligase
MNRDETFYNWMFLCAKGVSLESFFRDNHIRNIAIYGCDKLGELLYLETKKYSVSVTFAIDKNKDWFHDLPLVRPNRVRDAADKVDCIVVCIEMDHYTDFEIGRFLDDLPIPSIYLGEVVTACFYKEILLPLCKEKGLTPIFLGLPMCKNLDNLSGFEKTIAAMRHQPSIEEHNPAYFDELYADIPEYNPEYIANVYSLPSGVPYKNTMILPDMRTNYMNITGGMRLTHFHPNILKKTIHILGHCAAYGLGVDDSRTIASHLQRKLNAHNGSMSASVFNHGQVGIDIRDLMLISNIVEFLRCKAGDILVTIVDFLMDANRNAGVIDRMLNAPYDNRYYYCLRDYFNARRKKPAYTTGSHLSPYGMALTADYIFQILTEDGRFVGGPTPWPVNTERSFSKEKPEKDVPEYNTELAEYLRRLREMRTEQSAGAIVMNCNPFTKGHRYLVEQAAKETDWLYIFVVQEDQSDFSFEIRMEMVKTGVQDIENVICLPSGKYVLSAMTFPEYFSKDANQYVTVDYSVDLTLFGDKIAPCLNITKRFVGEEPFDLLTRQYNQAMKDILPGYGIEVIEYKRLSIDGIAVSASNVRKLLMENDWNGLKVLLPNTTYNILKRCDPVRIHL